MSVFYSLNDMMLYMGFKSKKQKTITYLYMVWLILYIDIILSYIVVAGLEGK